MLSITQSFMPTSLQVFFIDPLWLSLAATNDGEGFEIVFPKAWVAKALPYVKISLTMLKVAAVAGKLSGLPIPDIKVRRQKSEKLVRRLISESLFQICHLWLRASFHARSASYGTGGGGRVGGRAAEDGV
jgi:hypothetical protein